MRRKQLMTMALVAAALTSGVSARAGIKRDATIVVSNVDELYTAVNDPANAGAAVVLAPGRYRLSPNRGRLELQTDMSLYGVVGNREAVLIDASELVPSSFTDGISFGRTGIIRAGRGNNAIEWLTIVGHPQAAAAIETDLVETDTTTNPATPRPTTIRVAHVKAGNSARGVDIRNVTGAMAGRRLVAEIVDSDFFAGVEGIRVINFMGANGGDITVGMRGNRSYRNWLGCIVENNRSSNASIVVRSDGDRFDDNGLGCLIGGGLIGTQSGRADFNLTRFDAAGSVFTRNRRTQFFNDTGPMFTDVGGLLVIGGSVLPTGAPYTTSGNTVAVRLWDCKFGRNADSELAAFGARLEGTRTCSDENGQPVVCLAGTNNNVVIELHGESAFVDVVAIDSEPQDPNGTNTVTVVPIPNAPHQ